MNGAGKLEELGSTSAEESLEAPAFALLNGTCSDLEMLTQQPILRMLDFPSKSKLDGQT